MSHPKNLRIEDFTYQLAEERIARHPLNDRDASKLLIYKNGTITEDIYKNISLHIPSETLMVFNQTRVVNARLLLKKNTGSIIEVFMPWSTSQHCRYTCCYVTKMVPWFGNVL